MTVLRRARRRPLLTREDEAELGAAIVAGRDAQARIDLGESRSGDQRLVRAGQLARQRFVESNIGLAVSMAHKMAIPPHVDRDDVVQDGLLGIERALDDFDHTRGWKFSTYATWWIRRSMQQGLENLIAPVRIPAHRSQELRSARIERDELGAELSPALAHAEAMTRMGSLDQQIGADRSQVVGDLVASEWSEPDRELEADVDRRAIAALLALVDPDNAALITARYGLDGAEPRSLVELAAERGVTPEAVRRRIVRALARLRPEAERLTAATAA